MTDDLAASIATAITQAFGSLASSILKSNDLKMEAEFERERAVTELAETREEMKRIAREAEAFKQRQKVVFLSNGVTISGSALLTLQETEDRAVEEIENLKQSGLSRQMLSRYRIQQLRNRGKAKLLGGVGKAGASIFKATLESRNQDRGGVYGPPIQAKSLND